MEAIPMGCIETELDETIMPKTQHKEEIHYVENEEKAHRDHDSVGFDGVIFSFSQDVNKGTSNIAHNSQATTRFISPSSPNR